MHSFFGRTEEQWAKLFPQYKNNDNKTAWLYDEVRHYICRQHIAAGVIILDPANTVIDVDVKIGKGTVIHPYSFLRGATEIGCDCIIFSFCDISDSIFGDGVDVRSSFVVGAKIGDGTTVGPFATLRSGAVVGKGCRVGDYVEVKKAVLGDGVKAAHLAYIGDAVVGEGTNVGCGTVFANYNGKIKQQTTVGKNAFIGANTNLVAPITVGENAYIAAGSTVTEDVPTDLLCIARARQVIKNRRN